MDKTQEIEIANCVLDNQTAMGLSTLDGRVEVLERQGEFLLDQQERDHNAWTNVSYGLKTDIEESEERFNTRLDLLRRSQQSLCCSFNEARREMGDVVKIARHERKRRQAIEKDLRELKEEFAELKGMVRSAVAAQNLQNNEFPTEDIVDVFNPRIVEEPSSSSDEEVPQENLVPVPVPGPSFEIPQTLWEIPPSPSPSLRAFLSEPIVIASSIPPLGSSPQLLRLLVEDSSVGVGSTVEEFEEAVEREAEAIAMVDSLVESGEEPLTNDPDAVAELEELWDCVVDTSPVEGDFEERYPGGGVM